MLSSCAVPEPISETTITFARPIVLSKVFIHRLSSLTTYQFHKEKLIHRGLNWSILLRRRGPNATYLSPLASAADVTLLSPSLEKLYDQCGLFQRPVAFDEWRYGLQCQQFLARAVDCLPGWSREIIWAAYGCVWVGCLL